MNSNGYNVGKMAFESCEFADCGEPGSMPLINKGNSINITKCKFICTNSECLDMILGMMRSSTNANSIWRRCDFHRISQWWLQNVHSFSLTIKSKATMADSFQVTNMKNEPTIEINTFQNDKYMISIIYHQKQRLNFVDNIISKNLDVWSIWILHSNQNNNEDHVMINLTISGCTFT